MCWVHNQRLRQHCRETLNGRNGDCAKGRCVVNEYKLLKMKIMELVADSKDQRVRPNDARQTLTHELGTSPFVVGEAVKELVEEGDLVYTYRDPCSYVEIPCNGCDGVHHTARPMHVITDRGGNRWLCDAEVNLTDDLPGQCWECGEMAFTRAS